MAATVKDAGSLGLSFGVPTNGSVVMQSMDETRSIQIAEASDEDGDVVGAAFYGGQRMEISGEYLVKGSADIGTLGASITLTGIKALSPAGTVYLTEVGTKWSNTGFRSGTFKAIAISGVTG
jgi:hypothetical protein